MCSFLRIFLLALLATCVSSAAGATSLIREEQIVPVDGVNETWRLEWEKPPHPYCEAENENWMTCPCHGFAFGEAGKASLVRIHNGKTIEKLALSSLFNDSDSYAPNQGEAVLQRWNAMDSDIGEENYTALAARARKRPQVKIMQLADYDHDGNATEFFLQTTTMPCGKKTGVVIGLSPDNRHLHVFATVLRPGIPLQMQYIEWQALLKTNGAQPVRVIDWQCGDHASETENEMELRVEKTHIVPVMREFTCTQDGKRGALAHEEKW